MKKRFTGVAAFVLSASLLLSTACSKKDSKKKSGDSDLNEDIVEVVEDYFKNLSEMSFKKVKKAVEDSAFSDLDLKSDEFDVLSAYLEKVEIEVTEADGKEKKGTGSATVSVTYVDLKTIIKDLDDSDDAEEYIDAIQAKKAKTKEEEIELDLVYDDEWKIEDDTPVYDLLMGEFETICENISGSPVQTDPTTESTTEATTAPTTTEDTTTTTTTEATSEDSSTSGTQAPTGMQTLPSPGITDRHIKVGQDFLDTCGNHGFTYELSKGNEYDTYLLSIAADDMALIYCEFKDAATCDKYAEQLIDQVVYTNMKMDKGETVYDEWDGNTHHIYSQNNSAYNGHSIDMYIYRDDTVMVFVAIDQFPQADVSIEYYELLDELGIWKM